MRALRFGEDEFLRCGGSAQPKAIVDSTENRFGQVFSFEGFQVNIGECFLEKSMHEKDETSAVGK
jgi:hypothetical protein